MSFEKIFYLSLSWVLTLFSLPILAQIPDSSGVQESVPSTITETFPKFVFKGMLQGRYIIALADRMDVEGMHHAEGDYTSNSFDLKRVRVQTQIRISPNTEVAILANLADFKSSPQNKVLENAYVKYTVNPAIQFVLGQFRPWFGIEETYPVDIIKSLDFSNQYYTFGSNGWASFQQGISMMGTIPLGQLRTQYALSVINGNGRNQAKDKDNGKQFISRLVFDLFPKSGVQLGLNAGYGEVFKRSVHAFGVDLTGKFDWGSNWSIDMQAEAKQGINHSLFYSLDEEARLDNLDRYVARGIYFLPNLRYDVNYKRLNAVEFSMRYEYLDVNYKVDPMPRHTFTPMFGLAFLKDYGARIQVGMILEHYNRQVDNTSRHDNGMLVFQLQTRF